MLSDREKLIHWIAHYRMFYGLTPYGMILGEDGMIKELNEYRKHYAITVSFDDMMVMINESRELVNNDKRTMQWKYAQREK